MGKVVINSCYGGFSLSREACQRYWDLKGEQVWIEDDTEYPSLGIFTVWLVPPSERVEKKTSKEFASMSLDERVAYSQKVSEQSWYDRDVERNDPVLVQVVEELGDKANGKYSKLRVVEVDGLYKIDEYDGYESIETPDQIEWSYA